jgi:hypothetical protein
VSDVIEYAETVTETTLQSSITDRSQIDHRSITSSGENANVINSDIGNAVVSEIDHTPADNRGGGGGQRATVTLAEEELTLKEKKQLIEVESTLTAGILWKEGEISDREMINQLAKLKKKAGARLYGIACERLKDEDRSALELLRFNHSTRKN